MVAGRHPARPPFPFSPGLETAGVVAACGEGVTRFAVGDRVMAILAYGGLAEMALADEAETFAVPDGMPFDEAGAFPIPYISSHLAIRLEGRLEGGAKPRLFGGGGGGGPAGPGDGEGAGGPRDAGPGAAGEESGPARRRGRHDP